MRPLRLDVPAADLQDLTERLARTRLPDPSPHEGWTQGLPLDVAHDLLDHWRTAYDWRRVEAELDAAGQHATEIDGVEVHLLHVRSPVADARPLVLTHGWPGSVVEFLDVLGPLTDPVAHGGAATDAFHVIAPSLPGYGFSSAPRDPGWSVERIADAWVVLVDRLGYGPVLAHGGDWGSLVSTAMAVRHPSAVAGLHTTMPVVRPTADEPDEQERRAIERYQQFSTFGSGYAALQSTRPQALGYALADSPWGQAAWILDRFHAWTDPAAGPFGGISRDRLLDNVMTYWLGNNGASSAWLYVESWARPDLSPVEVPTGVSQFPEDLMTASRRWVAARHRDLRMFREHPVGGHFPGLEQPTTLVDDLRAFAREL